MKNNFPWWILILATALRLIFLNSFPTSISNDELHFVLNAKSVFLDFKDLSGSSWFPLSFSTIPNEASSELLFLISSLLIGVLPLSLFFSKLFFVLISVFTVGLVFLIANKLFSYRIGLISALVFAFNPWSIYVGRTAFDAPVTLMFFLLYFYLLLTLPNRKILLSFIPAFIGFFTYIGTKVIFIPFIFFTSFYAFKYVKNLSKYNFSIIIGLSLLTTIFFYLSLTSTTGTRLSELISPQHPEILFQSQLEKDQSLRSPFKIIYSHPFIILARQSLSKYLNNFSPDILFLTGDHTFMISLWKHGYFYYLDLIFLLIGFFFLFSKYPRPAWLILFLILLSPIPEAVRIDKIPAYAFHSVLLFPLLSIVIGCGIFFFLSRYPKLTKFLIFGYLILFLNFIDIYFFKYPVYQSEGFFFSRRVIANYLKYEKNNTTAIYVFSHEPESIFRNYLFFNNLVTKTNLNEIRQVYQNSNNRQLFKWDNIIISSQIIPNITNATIIFDKDFDDSHYKTNQHYQVNRLSDPSALFKIYHGQICQNEPLDLFSHHLNIFDFNLENFSAKRLCQKFITQGFD